MTDTTRQIEVQNAEAAVPATESTVTLERIEGRTMREALLRARKILGETAVVVGQRRVKGGVVLAVSRDVPRSTVALDAMRTEADRIFAGGPRKIAPAPLPPAHTPLADIERRMRANGASRKLRERILEGVAGRLAEGGHPVDVAAEEAGAVFPVATLPRGKRTVAVIAFVGQTGVGKTTSLAKLAARLVRSGRKVALATLDAWRVGAVAQLEAYGKLLDAPAYPLSDAARLARDLANGSRVDAVLVDGSGDLTRDIDQLLRLGEALENAGVDARLVPLVVLPATASSLTLGTVTKAVKALDTVGAVITKLDEAALAVPVLEHTLEAELKIAFLSDGADIARHFHRADPERFADLVLRGRLA